MTDSHYRQTFLEWIVANDLSSDSRPERFAITLVASPRQEPLQLGRDLSTYLNEFDEAGGGAWASFNDDITKVLAGMDHPAFRHECRCEHGGCPCQQVPEMKALREHRRMVRRFAEIGNAVLVHDEAHQFTHDLPGVFQVLLHEKGTIPDDVSNFHLILNTGRLTARCAVRIVADSALDWAHSSIAA